VAEAHSTDAGRVAASYGFRDVTAEGLGDVSTDLPTPYGSHVDHWTKARTGREARPDTLINVRPSKDDMEMGHPALGDLHERRVLDFDAVPTLNPLSQTLKPSRQLRPGHSGLPIIASKREESRA
jgi:hypothetical protein